MVDNVISVDTYNELYNTIILNKSLVSAVPQRILSFIKNMAKESKITFSFSTEEEAFSQVNKDTLALYVLLFLKYSDASDAEKEQVKNKVAANSVSQVKLNNLGEILKKELQKDNDKIIKKVRQEAEESALSIYPEDAIGYEEVVVEEMQKRLDELGISWSPYLDENVQ